MKYEPYFMKQATFDIIETANDAIFIINLDGLIVDCNSAAENLYGYNDRY